ncbi:hypothetical protein [Streptomonospora salina]|uniref:Uncharacterized protein n=1 Tax=Streptomonospora salina TaxID=104205 RepID=A0A841EDD6_9ACTN|nr:hypothetical protein [Streptomonospora salina]MBB5999073.1 hypothetical protein [Streptomonospora salina]
MAPDIEDPAGTPGGDPAAYTVVSAVGGPVLGRVLADEAGDRWTPVVTVAGRDVLGPPFPAFGDAALWVCARLTVVLDAPRSTAGETSPLSVLEHGYKRHGAIWTSGYEGYD